MPRAAVDFPAPAGLPFSAAIRAGEFIYLSGQVGYDADRNVLVGGGVRAEAEKLLAMQRPSSRRPARASTMSSRSMSISPTWPIMRR